MMDDVTIHELLAQYDGRIGELQASLGQARFHGTIWAAALSIAVALFLTLTLFAVRQKVSFLWLSLPISLAAASARRFGQYRRSQSGMWRLRRFYDRAVQR